MIAAMIAVTLGAAPAAPVARAASPQARPQVDLQKLGQRAAPEASRRALAPLAGKWRVEKAIFVAMGTPSKPAASSEMTTVRKWIGGGRYLRDTTTGTVAGKPYSRTGLLGYNSIDRRFEWSTADNQTPIMMTYLGSIGSGPPLPTDLRGSFTDLGVTGEANVGKTVTMRTHIEIVDPDNHVFEIYFTPSGGKEMLADRMRFTRMK